MAKPKELYEINETLITQFEDAYKEYSFLEMRRAISYIKRNARLEVLPVKIVYCIIAGVRNRMYTRINIASAIVHLIAVTAGRDYLLSKNCSIYRRPLINLLLSAVAPALNAKDIANVFKRTNDLNYLMEMFTNNQTRAYACELLTRDVIDEAERKVNALKFSREIT